MDSLAILDLLGAQYKASDVFDYVEPGKDTGVYYSLKRCPEGTVVCLRGSVDLQDWFRDAIAILNPLSHEVFGPVHAGFMAGMDATWQDIKGRSAPPYIVAGHSLGAARAALLSAIMKRDGVPPILRIGAGEPHPGTMKLRVYLASVPCELYRTTAGGHVDSVTQVPPTILAPYCPSAQYIDLPAVPDGTGIFSLHHIQIYRDALASRKAA